LLATVLLCGCADQTHVIGTIDRQQTPLDGNGGFPPVTGAPVAGAAAGEAPSSAGTGQSSGMPGAQAGDPLPAPVIAPDGCEFTTAPAAGRRLDMYLMVDGIITQSITGAWDNVRRGIMAYVGDARAAGTGVGLRVFGLQCSAQSYAMPDAEVDLLPGNAEAVRDALPRIPFNASPMLPALQGAILHARSRAGWYPEWRQIVVMITDGFPDPTCFSGREEVLTAAQDGLAGGAGAPPVPTYVIGVREPSIPNPFDPLAELGLVDDELDMLASAGGTTAARHSNISEPPQTLADALLEIQRDAEPCEYAVPEGVDPAQWTLSVDHGGSPPLLLPRVAGADGCADGGYYFDQPDTPGWAIACPRSCQQIKASGRRALSLSGCDLE
jgi:hypothetical protein